MDTSLPSFSANNSQIVRYNIQLPSMLEPDSLVSVREVLQSHNLVVDRVAPGEAVVASATGSEPDWPTIKDALKAAGHPVEHTATVEE